MAHNPSETWHPFKNDTDRNIPSITKSDPTILNAEENINLDKYLYETKKTDYQYLHSHPEIKGVIIFVLSELVKHNPKYIKKFCSHLFQHYNGECLRKIVEGILSKKINDDSSSESDSIVVNEPYSDADETGGASGGGVRF